MTDAIFQASVGELALVRPGGSPGLRAWDAADELLLDAAATRLQPESRVLVVDDQFGALTLGLAGHDVCTLADSAVLPNSLAANVARNPGLSVNLSVMNWRSVPSGPFDLVVLRIPRQAAYLAWILRWINGVLADGGQILAGGMIKHLPDRSVEVFSEAVVTDEVLPARKKARVVVCHGGSALVREWPDQWKGYRLEGALSCRVEALPAVFARDRLDIGTRELLPLIPEAVARVPERGRILDLACGNGVLGLSALARRPELEVHFSDVSSQAIASVERNLSSLPGSPTVQLWHQDGVADEAPDYDLILLNPPFHEGGVVGDHIALRLFRDAARHLAPGGRVLMVGNRHLGYHRSLKKYFRNVSQKVASPRFVVFEASREP
ncbi:methyltransferase [Marinobacter daepoensis]|uniref:Class I SAM-dependent methyltransferase n=1 Tax=Marinobacter daepoensis TaxID=262077 RepID=A0ABS3BH57_9GAMM|nr:methyltransferase [Marinobacter daepoensis]MBN7769565.1 class I SAM-dependent methyltransferase [Marinobacter daepoensis]MBY6078255.1 methyltransferase [Marinobacter daepoensis]